MRINPSHFATLGLCLALFSGAIGCSPGTQDTPQLKLSDQEEKLFQEKNISRFSLRGTKKLALTTDDGPTRGVTDRILDLLQKEGVKATFFVTFRAGENKRILERIVAEGHTLANHSYKHDRLSKSKYISNPNLLISEIENVHNIIERYMNPSHRMYFRAPGGSWTSEHASVLNARRDLRDYIGPIYWDVGGQVSYEGKRLVAAADWDCWKRGWSASDCAKGYLREVEAKQGGVVLMHDLEVNSARMAEILIPELKSRGYQFISLDDVRALDQYQ